MLFLTVFSYVSSNEMQSHIGYICLTFLHRVFQMCPQMPRLKGCIVALITFVSFFSTVCYQMCPQMVRIRRYVVALGAFV